MILVGCPLARRDWIITHYLEYTATAIDRTGLDYRFIFLGDVASDPVFPALDIWCAEHNTSALKIQSVHDTPAERAHAWHAEDYYRMAALRNQLLQEVRKIQPEYFLSLDSDILLAPQTVTQLLETAEKFDAVGGKCYMTPPQSKPKRYGITTEKRSPSYGKLKRNGNFTRSEASGVFQVDILMAIKLMSQKAYDIDYTYDHRGEDLGWSQNCRNAGLKLGWDGRTVNKHVWSPRHLYEVDDRVGW